MAVGARVLEHNLMVYRRVWHGSVLGSLLSPVLFLAAMGIGLGGYVNRGGAGALGGVSYLAFLAPGLLAAQAMQTAAFETTYPIMGKIVWDKLYDAMLATPLTVRDLLAGELEWLQDRVLLYADDGEAAAEGVHARGVRPESVLVRRSSLEDVFLRLTGRSLVD